MITELKFKKILIATDFLQGSHPALDYAAALARHFGASIVMLHVIELSDPAVEAEMVTLRPSMTRHYAEEKLKALASGIRHSGVTVETYVEHGILYDEILRAVTTHAADMIVMGIHAAHRGLDHFLIGSNLEKVLLSAPCPMLTVGPNVLEGVDFVLNPKEILYFSDFTPEAAAAAPYALLFGKEFHVPVDVCQLVPVIAEENSGLRQMIADEYCERMPQVIYEPLSDWCLPAFHLEHGMEIDEIIKRAKTQLSSLIVLGVKKRSQLRRHLHASFAYQLLTSASCPVLTIQDKSVLETGPA